MGGGVMNDEPKEYELEPLDPRSSIPLKSGATPSPTPPGTGKKLPDINDSFEEEADEAPAEETPEQVDARTHRAAAMLAYVLFFLPLLMHPKSRFVRFHANQGLLVFLLAVGWFTFISIRSLILAFGPTIEALAFPLGLLSFFSVLLALAWFCAVIYLSVKGLLNAADGEWTPLPIFGHITLLQDPPPTPPTTSIPPDPVESSQPPLPPTKEAP